MSVDAINGTMYCRACQCRSLARPRELFFAVDEILVCNRVCALPVVGLRAAKNRQRSRTMDIHTDVCMYIRIYTSALNFNIALLANVNTIKRQWFRLKNTDLRFCKEPFHGLSFLLVYIQFCDVILVKHLCSCCL